ncbi:hypothetical protein AB0B25_01345 [Nocardia sp. NPDC049190]|uniref:hypothetical protein n=1 Tax=Nocardia sp. NPDC049190 TaxID=3155650 RepID=UPI0033C37DB7
MSTGFDIRTELVRGVGDRAGAWQFIKEFVAHWMSPLTEADGFSEAELAPIEDLLERRLPPAMREAYGLFGRRSDLTSRQDDFRPPTSLFVDDDEEIVTFRVENQGVVEWGVRISELVMPDPPVLVRSHLDDTWNVWLDRFSLACIELVLSESLCGEVELIESRCLTDTDLAGMEQLFTRLPIPECRWDPDVPGYRWFAGQDVLLRVDPANWLFVRARTPEALDELRRSWPGDRVLAEDS